MTPGRTTAFARTTTALGANAVFLSDVMAVGPTDLMKMLGGFSMVRGFISSNVAGRIDIFQGWDLADMNAITAGVPAAGVGNAALLLQTAPHPSTGVNDPGTDYTMAIVAPFVRVRYTNGAGAQATFRLDFSVVE